jgi:hypothetical protein
MFRLKDPIRTAPSPPGGIELPPLREPESLDSPSSYVSSSGATVMTGAGLAEARNAAIPPTPGFDRYGERVSHMTDRFVLSGSSQAYRIFRFQSAEPAVEFPVTREGWALAWTKFRELDSQIA